MDLTKPISEEVFEYLNGSLLDVEIPILKLKDRPQIYLGSESGMVEVVWVKKREEC